LNIHFIRIKLESLIN